MSRKPLLIAIVVLVLAGIGYWIYRKSTAEATPEYRFATVERGSLEATVSATGALGAVKAVQIGTQVSGQIAEIYVDFNSRVKKGQLLARIDPTLQQQAIQDAQASLDRARADQERTRLEYERNKSLFENKVLTEVEFNTAKYSHEVADAQAKSAQIALQRAQRNLEYTSIHSPIDGIVVDRTVDVGQTVAASYSTPQLFLIAQDLSQMQILASVDESDIGRIQTGQKVRFSVQAFADRKFEGEVKQMRLQSKTTENVVNYTVVVGVNNPDGKLLPGMTATLEFLTGSAHEVLMVPNAALRFRPPEAMLAKLREEMTARFQERMKARGQTGGADAPAAGNADAPSAGAAQGASVPGGFGPGGLGQNGRPARGRSDRGMLYYLDAAGKLSVMPVKVGISDGQKTEVQGRELKEGMKIIVGVTQEQQASSTQNIFQPGPPAAGQRRRGGGMF